MKKGTLTIIIAATIACGVSPTRPTTARGKRLNTADPCYVAPEQMAFGPGTISGATGSGVVVSVLLRGGWMAPVEHSHGQGIAWFDNVEVSTRTVLSRPLWRMEGHEGSQWREDERCSMKSAL